MRKGLLAGAPQNLRAALESLVPVESPIRLNVDMAKAADLGLCLDDFDACGGFLFSVQKAGENELTRMFSKLLGPDWDSYFVLEPQSDTTLARELAMRSGLAMLTAGGRKLGVIGG